MALAGKRILCEVVAPDPVSPDPVAPGTPGRPLVANAGTVVYSPRATLGPRAQQTYELVLLHSGALRLEVDGAERQVAVGQVVLLLPGQRCRFRFARDAETHHSWLNTTHPLVPAALRAVLDAWPSALPLALPISPGMARLLETALALRDGPGPTGGSLVALASAGLVLYWEEARARDPAGGSRVLVGEHPAVRAARDLVRRRLDQHLALADLAAAGHVAPEHLVRLFRRDAGTTPVRYLWAERVRMGVYLLEHTGLPVAEVAARVGCQTPKHFSRLVRLATGLPPREVRRRSWGPPDGIDGVPAPGPHTTGREPAEPSPADGLTVSPSP